MLAGQLNFGDIQRLPRREEAIVLRAIHQTLVDYGICLTQETDAGPLLVCASYLQSGAHFLRSEIRSTIPASSARSGPAGHGFHARAGRSH